ncbi:MAG: adenylate/guanylate cyclase domain-containing protein, partial [Actinomycetota bacterium]
MSEKVLPGGTISFLFTDMEGSTRLLQRLGASYVEVLEQHRHLLLQACAAHGGEAFGSEGDSIVMAFSRATDSVRAALQAQLEIAEHAWPEGGTVRVRIGLHTGEAEVVEGNYVGLALHRAQRICSAAHGGQILLSATTRELTADALPADATLRDLEYHRLKDLGKPERLFQLVHPGLRRDFPSLRTLDVLPNNIPLQLTSFIGREHDVAEVVNLLSTKRLVSLTGPGGVGKTRLGLQVAAELLDQHADGAWMVDLSAISDPSWIPNAVAVSVGMRQGGPSASVADDEGSGGETGAGRTIVEQLVDHLRVNETLLLFDNCEHLVSGVSDVAEALLRGCPKVRILATTRERLDVPGEVTWAVPTLSVPDLTETPPADTLNDYEAIRLFVERAAQQHPGFQLNSDNAAHVVQIVNRLEGLPLAIELAAARMRVLTPEQISVRLDDRFRLLAGGAKSLPDRQQTLLGAIDWSYELLTDAERHLLTAVSVFAGGFTIAAAERVWEGEGMAPADVFELVTQLVDKSLLVHEARKGEARYRLLDSIRQYGWEKVLNPRDPSSH